MRKIIGSYVPVLLGIACLLTSLAGCTESHSTVSITDKIAGDSVSEKPSVYLIESLWQKQTGDTIKLDRFKGKIPVVSMIFTRCAYACPRTIADLKNIEKQLPAAIKNTIHLLSCESLPLTCRPGETGFCCMATRRASEIWQWC